MPNLQLSTDEYIEVTRALQHRIHMLEEDAIECASCDSVDQEELCAAQLELDNINQHIDTTRSVLKRKLSDDTRLKSFLELLSEMTGTIALDQQEYAKIPTDKFLRIRETAKALLEEIR